MSTFLLKLDDGYGHMEAELTLSETGGVIVWIGNNGVELREMEISTDEAKDLFCEPGVVLGELIK